MIPFLWPRKKGTFRIKKRVGPVRAPRRTVSEIIFILSRGILVTRSALLHDARADVVSAWTRFPSAHASLRNAPLPIQNVSIPTEDVSSPVEDVLLSSPNVAIASAGDSTSRTAPQPSAQQRNARSRDNGHRHTRRALANTPHARTRWCCRSRGSAADRVACGNTKEDARDSTTPRWIGTFVWPMHHCR